MKYTANDVQLAHSASVIRSEAKFDGVSPESVIRSYIDDELNPNLAEEEIVCYHAGVRILESARLIYAPNRSTVPILSNGKLYHEFPDADSPAVLIPAGHIATNQAWTAVALKEHKP